MGWDGNDIENVNHAPCSWRCSDIIFTMIRVGNTKSSAVCVVRRTMDGEVAGQ